MNSRQKKTLKAVFDKPIKSNLPWLDIESLLVAIGCEIVEGSGSAVRFTKNGNVAWFHRPHPQKEAKPYQVKDARQFLEKLGIKP